MRKIAMIPARMGSQRLKKKNLRKINGIPLITHAIRRTQKADIFDEIWVNTESDVLGNIGIEEGVNYHKRPADLANNQATSEDFVYEFLKNHKCEYLFQVHTIAPLLFSDTIIEFVKYMMDEKPDVLLSCVNEKIECAYKGEPINFNPDKKTNSQKLEPIQRITWSITGWNSDNYIKAYEDDNCATYSGDIAYFSIPREAGHIIKTYRDLLIAKSLYNKLEVNQKNTLK